MTFREVFDASSNMLTKVGANFGRGREICLALHNNRVYCHLFDKSKAFVDGKFDISKCKSVTFGENEVFYLKSLLGYFDQYALRLKSDHHTLQHVSIDINYI